MYKNKCQTAYVENYSIVKVQSICIQESNCKLIILYCGVLFPGRTVVSQCLSKFNQLKINFNSRGRIN